MRIGILECGETPAPLLAQHGSYPDMLRRLLGPGHATPGFAVTRGVLPATPGACEAYVLTGSPAGVYEDLPWIPPLLAFLRAARGRVPLVGICFGHQAMTMAFGGRVVQAPAGWGLGLHRYRVARRAAWMDAAEEVALPASHQDQVVTAPADASVALASDFTPHAGLDYGNAISFQFHPEFTPEFAAALVEMRRDRIGGAAADAAIRSLDAPNDCARVGGWIGRFLQAAGRPASEAGPGLP